ncbi:Pre-mRNA-splicing factor PRP46 [Entamoeba marina]
MLTKTDHPTTKSVNNPHPSWKLKRVLCGHKGWVSSIAFDASNEWFATGSHDEMIKIWGLIKGDLRLTLTGHIGAVKALKISPRHPYLFSAGEDKTVKCWDLESNRVVKHYHGHLSGVYCLDLHPSMDVIATGGRDSVVRLWDIRTKQQLEVFEGHTSTIHDVKLKENSPHLISASADGMIRCWDMVAGKCLKTYTQHKKGVRALCIWDDKMLSASADSIKLWDDKGFVKNFNGMNGIINSLSRNDDGCVFACGSDGELCMFDDIEGEVLQRIKNIPHPGSLECESGVLCSTFDETGLRFFTGNVDKTIKMYIPTDEVAN